MVTPSQPADDGSTAVESHRYRAVAESFGIDPSGYDRWRPRYPESLIDRIIDTSPGPRFLDVGIGTGIDARQFRHAGAEVTGIEPDPRMAGFARNDGFPVYESTFEDWDPAGRIFDAVVAGQTWHWVDPVAGAVKARQVLRSGGRLALFWNVGDAPAAVNEAYATAFARAVPNSPVPFSGTPPPAAEAYRTIVDRVAAGFQQAGGFEEPEHWQDAWDQAYTREEYLAMLPTQGLLTWVPREQAEPVLAAVGAAIDRLEGSFVMHYVTTTVTTVTSG